MANSIPTPGTYPLAHNKREAKVIETAQSDVAKVTTGTAAPTSTPSKAGDVFVDTNNGNVYIAKGTTDENDWVQVNNA